MKTEISRNSHDPEKRYSGVYQQQGRMITDADWNELVDILKSRLGDALGDVVGSGIPAQGGMLQGGALCWGTAYVEGVPASLAPAKETIPSPVDIAFPVSPAMPMMKEMNMPVPFAFDRQADFPMAGGNEPSVGHTLFLDVWERTVTSYDDPALMDSALHGADTCSRTQTMTQLKWCADAMRVQQVAGATKAVLRVAPTSGYAGNRGNFMFRLEVHQVTGSGIVLKWSRENAAEQFYRLDADGVEQFPPEYFTQGNRVFEYFTPESEKWLGFNGNVPLPADRDTRLAPEVAPVAETHPHVRRWDGYCEVNWNDASLNVVHDSLTGEQVSFDGANTIVLTLEDFTLAVHADAWQEGTLLAGDYWQFAVRPGEPLPGVSIAAGIRHHYLMLGTYSGSGRVDVGNGMQGEFSFPSLSRAHDTFVNVTGDTMTGPLNVHSALNVSRNAVIGGTLTVQGDLTVNGNKTTVNVGEMEVEDSVIRVNKYPNQPVPQDIDGGLEVFRGGNPAYPNAQLIWDEGADHWKIGTENQLYNLAYGPPWESLNDNSMADNKHRHSRLVSPNGTQDPAVAVNNAGYVGVGYPYPQARLTVNGPLHVGGNTLPPNGRIMQVSGDSGLQGACDIAGHLSISGGAWNLSASEGDVSVGNPGYRLKIGVATGGGGAGDVRMRAHGGTNRLILGGGVNDTLTIGDTNVGIGTLTPGERLEVVGNVKATTFIGDGSQLTGIASGGKWSDGNSAGKIHYSSGNVGIGTNGPTVPLHVNGACRVENNLTVKGRLYGAVEGPGGEEYRVASGQTARSTTNWIRSTANTIYVDVDTTGAGFAVVPQYYFNLVGDAGHHTVMGTGCVCNPTKDGFRVYLHRESGVTVTEARTNKWYIQWTAVGHDRLAGLLLHPLLDAPTLATLVESQVGLLGSHYGQLAERVTLLDNLNSAVNHPTTGLAFTYSRAYNSYNEVFRAGTGLRARAGNLEITATDLGSRTGSLESTAGTLDTRTGNLQKALNTNADVLAGLNTTANVAKLNTSFAVSTMNLASISKLNVNLFPKI